MHTYKLINRAGKESYVKFHWKTKQGEAMLAELTGFAVVFCEIFLCQPAVSISTGGSK